ncbi:hypothetical protein Cni_G15667 [Canna indica]|uniref:Plant-specific domain TIGR01615 family protein n=1 Tax=Canna indica TaxID=4628 RepID=A0AAQ3KIA4_9LILI|nr:hypothetical protein Cni_G15667 [Canna indica]
MLLAREFGVRVGEAPSPPAIARRRRPAKLGPWVLDPRPAAWSPGGRNGGGEGDCRIFTATRDRDLMGQIGGYSHESEHDLALMVSDFLENGSGSAESRYSSDSDCGFSDLAHLAEKILVLKRNMTQRESDLQSFVHSLIFSISEVDLYLVKEEQCNASCIRQSLVKQLKLSGYDAAVCSARWQSIDKVPGGDHEYIDVLLNDVEGSERLIIDIDFRSHFEIARAVASYDALLSSLPVVYVGPLPRLKQLLQVMVDAAKFSLKQNSMPLPPWRSLAYLQAKWCSKFERKQNVNIRSQHNSTFDHRQCIEYLQGLKTSLKLEIESERLLKPITNDKKRMVVKPERQRFSLLSC